mmetsp:Transcript_28300/g.45854  ORF Transcript_28300/g.45854 Transcript_28300/m.45854 type:complete len:133 (-) Transcript_28300:2293-2691(-)
MTSNTPSGVRLIPLHTSNFCLYVYLIDGLFYVDRAVNFGSADSGWLFEVTMRQVMDACYAAGMEEDFGFRYFDDLRFLDALWQISGRNVRIFRSICQQIGLPLQDNKRQELLTSLQVIGAIPSLTRLTSLFN